MQAPEVKPMGEAIGRLLAASEGAWLPALFG
jgi:hypothetical protein